MLRKIKLYGELADFVGHKEFEVKADTLTQAVSFLINNFQGIEKFMSPKYYQVKVGNYAINEEEITHPIGQEDIHFIPVISGAGRGFGKILLGSINWYSIFNASSIWWFRFGWWYKGRFISKSWISYKDGCRCWCKFSFVWCI